MTTITINHLCKAQFGEDRVLWQVFQGRTEGFFVEVGAYDGVTLSNTYFLEQMGWSGLLVEPIGELCQRATVARPRSRVVHAACSKQGSHGTATFTIAQNVPVLSYLNADEEHIARCRREGANLVEIEVPLRTLDDILREQRNSATGQTGLWRKNGGWCIDLVSIDTEGCELDVLDGLTLERFKPRVLVIENDRPSGSAIEPYLLERSYRKFHRQKINDFYIRADDAADDLTLDGLSG